VFPTKTGIPDPFKSWYDERDFTLDLDHSVSLLNQKRIVQVNTHCQPIHQVPNLAWEYFHSSLTAPHHQAVAPDLDGQVLSHADDAPR